MILRATRSAGNGYRQTVARGRLSRNIVARIGVAKYSSRRVIRQHPFDALAHVLEGEAAITVAGQPHCLHGGEMILMPAQQPHALKALKRFKMILTMIRS